MAGRTMSKTDWESRVGKLLIPRLGFPYAYKPVDSPLHGGAVRIDWLATDKDGYFWMVEVKYVQDTGASLNIKTDVSPLQRQALDDVATSTHGVPVLAVGHRDFLFLWGWRTVREIWSPSKPDLLPLYTASVVMHWTGPKAWPPFGTGLRESLQALGWPKDSLEPVPHLCRILSPSLSKPQARQLTLSFLRSLGSAKR